MKQLLKKLLSLTSALALLVALIPTRPAYAAFPGLNGRVLFTSSHTGNNEIYSMRLDGSDVQQLTNNPASDNEPAVSPDGTKFAFRTNRDGNNEIYVANIDGSNPTNASNRSFSNDGHPGWSPDGKKVIFKGSTIRFIYITDLENPTPQGSVETNATTNFGVQWPVWSPDGTKFAYNHNVSGSGAIVRTIGSDGVGDTIITNGPGQDLKPQWSPDNTHLTFYSTRDGNSAIYTMNANGSNQTRVTEAAASYNDSHPDWSPDGGKMIFVSDRTGSADIYLRDINSETEINLTNGSQLLSLAAGPSIQPLTIPPATLNPNITLNTTAGPVVYNAPANHTDTYESIDPASVTVTVQPQKGRATVDSATGIITYDPALPPLEYSSLAARFLASLDNLFFVPARAQSAAQDSFTYQICSTANAELCTETTVTVDLTGTAAGGGLASTGTNRTTLQMAAYTTGSVGALYIAYRLRRKHKTIMLKTR